MQLNLNELQHLNNAAPSLTLPSNFQLPSFGEFVPLVGVHDEYQTNFGDLGAQLLAAGILDPEAVSPDATTAKQVVEQGLREWFMKRIGPLQYMRFDVQVLDAENANGRVKDGQWNDSVAFNGPALAFTGDVAEMRLVEKIALSVEAKHPGLFLAAFSELTEASYRTIELQHPERILESQASYSLWGDDIHSITDEDAADALVERFGEDGEDHGEYHSPDAMLKAYGNGLCFAITRVGQARKKRRKYPDQKLKKLARDGDLMIAEIASALLNLRKVRRRIDELGASLALAHENGSQPLYVGCILLFSGDDRETQFMDDEAQQLFECGEGTDLYAIESLPTTATELKTRFVQLDALLDLIAQMDALIPKISYPMEDK